MWITSYGNRLPALSSSPINTSTCNRDAFPSHAVDVGSHVRCAGECRPDPLYHVVLLTLCASVLILAALLSIRDGSQVVVPIIQVPLPELCVARLTTGIRCPGCGLTRCFISLAHGDLVSAWAHNPAGLWLFAIMAFQIPFRTIQLWRIRHGMNEILLSRTAQIVLAIFAIGLIAQWALRLAGVSF